MVHQGTLRRLLVDVNGQNSQISATATGTHHGTPRHTRGTLRFLLSLTLPTFVSATFLTLFLCCFAAPWQLELRWRAEAQLGLLDRYAGTQGLRGQWRAAVGGGGGRCAGAEGAAVDGRCQGDGAPGAAREHRTALHSTVKHTTVQYSTLQDSTVQYITAQYSAVRGEGGLLSLVACVRSHPGRAMGVPQVDEVGQLELEDGDFEMLKEELRQQVSGGATVHCSLLTASSSASRLPRPLSQMGR